MKWFEHHDAHSIEEAVKLLHHYGGRAKVNAGGTDLLGTLRDRIHPEYPEAVINLKTIDGLDYITGDEEGLRIGALAALADIIRSPVVKEGYGLLADAVHSVATPQIRNMATIGGNLAQDIRCWFYRYPRRIGGPIVCLRKGGRFCNAMAGDNRYHSIFGAAPFSEHSCYPSTARKGCLAVSPSDIAVALVAMNGCIITTKRDLAAQEFFKATATSSTVLEVDELIREIQVPRPPVAAKQRYEKFTLRKPIDFAIVSVAAVMTLDNGVCKEARIVLGAVAPEPLRAVKAEEAMKQRTVDTALAVEAAEQAVAGARPLKMNAHKVEITKALVKRAVLG